MAPTTTPPLAQGQKAPPFALPGVDGEIYTLERVRGARGTLLMFLCNHCPYVRRLVDALVEDARAILALGVGVAAIMPNDSRRYVEDSFPNMKIFARDHAFCFPYLYDESQETARRCGAVCTPDFFGYDASLKLRYRGRRGDEAARGESELLCAMRRIAEGEAAPARQRPSLGCSIKWREEAVR